MAACDRLLSAPSGGALWSEDSKYLSNMRCMIYVWHIYVVRHSEANHGKSMIAVIAPFTSHSLCCKEAVHGQRYQCYQYFLQAAHQESFCGPPHPQVLRGSHAKATWDSEQTIGAQLFRGVFFCRSCQVYDATSLSEWHEKNQRQVAEVRVCLCLALVPREWPGCKPTKARWKDPRSGHPAVWHEPRASPIIPYHPLKHQQDPTRSNKNHEISRNQCGCVGYVSAVCLPWCWAERPKKAWALHLIHIHPYTDIYSNIQYIHVGAPLTSPRNNMHKDISLASLVLSDSVLPNPSQSLGICHDLPPVLSKHILRSTNLSGNCVYWTPTLLCPILSQPNHCCRTEVMTKKRRLGLSTPESHKQMEQDGTGKFAVPHICNSHLPCGAPNPHIHKPSVPFLLDSCAQSNCKLTVTVCTLYCRQTQAKTCLGGGTNTWCFYPDPHKPWLHPHTYKDGSRPRPVCYKSNIHVDNRGYSIP